MIAGERGYGWLVLQRIGAVIVTKGGGESRSLRQGGVGVRFPCMALVTEGATRCCVAAGDTRRRQTYARTSAR